MERAGIEVAEALQSMRENLIPPAPADAFHERAFKEDWDRAGFEVAEALQPLRKNIITPAPVTKAECKVQKVAKKSAKLEVEIDERKGTVLKQGDKSKPVAPKEGDDRKVVSSRKKGRKRKGKAQPPSKPPAK